MINVLKTIVIAAFVALAFVAVAANIKLPLGYRVLVVQSGSMEPAIPVGSVLLTKPTADFASPIPISRFLKGDVITYAIGKNNFVSHRVVEVVEQNKQFFYQTKGDANKTADQKLIAENEVVGKSIFAAPYIGRFVNFAKTPLGYLLMIMIPSLYVILSEIWSIIGEIRKSKPKVPSSGFALPIALIFVTAFYFTAGTAAYFSDTANSTNNTFQASQIFTNHLVISEVQARGSNPNGAAKDFVELYNPTNSPIDLNGYRLVRRNGNDPTDVTLKSWTSSTIIPAHGFYLWANSEHGFGASIGADTETTLNINNSASVALRFGPEDTGTIIDAVSWHAAASSLQEGTAFPTDPGQGESLERKASPTSTVATMLAGDALKGNGSDSNDNSADFVLRTVSQPQNSSSATESP